MLAAAMLRPIRSLFCCALLLTACTAAEWEIPEAHQAALPAGNDRIIAQVTDSPGLTRLTAAVLPPAPAVPEDPFAAHRAPIDWQVLRQAAGDATPPLPQPSVVLEIEWLQGFAPPEGFTRRVDTANGRILSSHRQERTTLRRTILASRSGDALFVHAIADQPGALGLRVRLLPPDPQTVETVDRRQLVAKGEGEPLAQAWVIPFESDVEPGEAGSIMIRGEGEALVVLNLAPVEAGPDWLADTWKRLGDRHDPGHWPPNPAKIWQGVLAGQDAAPP
jgi:hypothetical protein